MDPTGAALRCPSCDQPLANRGLFLARRDEDGERVCRIVWRCRERHVWWSWIDRPDAALEICPYPAPFGA